jgi:hypothetical protein
MGSANSARTGSSGAKTHLCSGALNGILHWCVHWAIFSQMELDSQTQHVFSVQGSFEKMQRLLEMELVVNGNAMLGLTTLCFNDYYLLYV